MLGLRVEQGLAASEAELADYKQRVTNEFTDTLKSSVIKSQLRRTPQQLAKALTRCVKGCADVIRTTYRCTGTSARKRQFMT